MRIYVKTPDGKKFWVPAPMWILKVGTGAWVESIVKRHVPEDQRKYIDCIDFSKLHKAVDVLKEYKGLTIVDVEAKDGTEVNIRL